MSQLCAQPLELKIDLSASSSASFNERSNLWVVDDEAANFTVIELLLSQESYSLTHFNSGIDLLAAIQQTLPDIILLDVMMPGIDGIEVCHRLKRSPVTRHIPILMVTALSSKSDLARCLEAGADDFISKPVNGVELRARVRSLLRMKRQYDDLQQLLTLRDEMLQLRTDLSNMVIHDLRNPLASISLSCQILQMYGLEPRTSQKVDQIEYATHRLESMIDSLLVTAKLEAGKLQVVPEPIDLPDLIQEVYQEFQAIAQQQQVSLALALPSQPSNLCGDPTLLRRVLDNLVANAVKFAPSNSTVTIAVQPTVDRLTIQVCDQGAGISPEQRETIFAKFEIGQHMPHVKQLGLGLAFCKMAVEAHNGSLTVTDNQPQGCIFAISLPQSV
jgi:two-component system, sensor histidine kinase and response regulator